MEYSQQEHYSGHEEGYGLPYAIMTLGLDTEIPDNLSMCRSCQCKACRGGCRSCRRAFPDDKEESDSVSEIGLESMFREIVLD